MKKIKSTLSGLFLGLLILVCFLADGYGATVPMDTAGLTDRSEITESQALRTVYCQNAVQVMAALRYAQPGDRIVIKAGTYTGQLSASGHSYSNFYSDVDGTAEAPITIESEDPNEPAILRGGNVDTGYVLYITGDYWRIKNLKITNGKKGMMFDHANYLFVEGCEVYNIGEEGIHLRDGSSNNIINNCTLHDIGLVTPGYGEGVYVGSDYKKWTEYKKECDHNVISNCRFGPNITAEHIDLKEGTTGTIVEGCLFNGTGITGANSADSFIDVKGNDSIIRNNIGYRNGNDKISDAFQLNERQPGWGYNNAFYGNTVYLDIASPFIVNVKKGSARVGENIRYPEEGRTYKGRVIRE